MIANAAPYGYGSTIADHPLGVFYDGGLSRWAIYNDDLTSMPATLAWNVFIPPQDGTLILHTSILSNTLGGPETYIDNPQFNFTPNAVIFVQHVFSPPTSAAGAAPESGGTYYTRTVAVTYDAGVQEWAIRNADGSAFPAGITFSALRASSDETFFTQTVTAANRLFPDAMALDNLLLNSNPDAQILVTQNYGAGLANDHRVGVAYDPTSKRWIVYNDDVARQWAIFNADQSAMASGVVYDVFVAPQRMYLPAIIR